MSEKSLDFTVKAAAVAMVATISAGFHGEKKDARKARMAAFWSDPKNARLIPAGRLLQNKIEGTDYTYADAIALGGSVTLPSIVIGGIEFPLPDGYKLSLASISTWGCVGCNSAHGTGVASSGSSGSSPDVDNLKTNVFYYRPSDGSLFVISKTCWTKWVVEMGANTPARFAPASKADLKLLPQTMRKAS